ncbi:MAG TPA: TetR/AcrR family transcriptional regulator [Acidimicrobiales bacterium]
MPRTRRTRSSLHGRPHHSPPDASPNGDLDREVATRSDRASRNDRAARREELLDAALQAIRRLGAGASMQELAAEAGVTKPILYRHFGDREGLVYALADRVSADLMRAIGVALAQPEVDPRGTVEATVDAFVAFIERDPEVYRLLVEHVHKSDATAAEALGGFLRQVGQSIALVLGEQLRAVGQDSGGAEVLAHGMVGLVHASGDWWLEHRTMPRARLVAYVTDLLWGGLSSMGLDGIQEENER